MRRRKKNTELIFYGFLVLTAILFIAAVGTNIGYAGSGLYSVDINSKECLDTDNGMDPFLKGKITFTDPLLPELNLRDSCLDDNTLIENYCVGTAPSMDSVDCSAHGMVCIEGACV